MSISRCTSDCVFPDFSLGDFSYVLAIIDEVAWREDLGLYDGKNTVVDVVCMNLARYSVFDLCMFPCWTCS